jgi:hypothetical protein
MRNPKVWSVSTQERENQERRHLLLRIPMRTRIDGRNIETVNTHNNTVKERGAVLFAKFGASIAGDKFSVLNEQITDGRKTWLIVVSKVGNSFVAHRAHLASIHIGQPPSEYERLIPAYYRSLHNLPKVWFRLDHLFEMCELDHLRLVSSKRRVLEVIAECRTPAMLVEECEPLQ